MKLRMLFFSMLVPMVAVADFPEDFCPLDQAILCEKYKAETIKSQQFYNANLICAAVRNAAYDEISAQDVQYDRLLKRAKKLKARCGQTCKGINIKKFN